jgi:hypothetical protein
MHYQRKKLKNAKTRSNSSPEDMQLDLATLNEKYHKSESSQRETSNRLEKLEGQMAGNTNQIAENTLQLG